MQHKFGGLGIAMVTPFLISGNVDFDGLTALTNHLIDGEVDFLVVQGTTGEPATMSLSEKQAVLEHVKKVNAGRLPLVFGQGGNNTQAIIDGYQDLILRELTPFYQQVHTIINQHKKEYTSITKLWLKIALQILFYTMYLAERLRICLPKQHLG